MTVVGDGPDYETYMAQWMRDHPDSRWFRCPRCRNWRILSGSPDAHCPLCPPKRKTDS